MAGMWLKIQPEDYQKLVDGHQCLIKMKVSKGHLTKHYNYCMYVIDQAQVTFSKDP